MGRTPRGIVSLALLASLAALGCGGGGGGGGGNPPPIRVQPVIGEYAGATTFSFEPGSCDVPPFLTLAADATVECSARGEVSALITNTTVYQGSDFVETMQLIGKMTDAGEFAGTFREQLHVDGDFDSAGEGTFRALVTGDELKVAFAGKDTVGATCVYTGSITARRKAFTTRVYIVSVSGHAPDQERLYLSKPGSAVEAIESVVRGLGDVVGVRHFADRFAADDDGFLGLLAHLESLRGDLRSPDAVLVLVAHSHGATWAHMATRVLLDVEVDFLISLDGVCLDWEREHAATVRAWIDANPGHRYAKALPLDAPCAAWTVGSRVYDTTDVVFGNVLLNLEVHGNWPAIRDKTPNTRLNGTDDEIETRAFDEGHLRLIERGSQSMAWVVERLCGEWPGR